MTEESLYLGWTWALLAGSAMALPAAYGVAWRRWRGEPRLARWLLASVVAAAVTRLAIAPHRIATVFLGYRSTMEAIDLPPVAHYGAGSQAFYHLVFDLVGADHTVLMATNAVVGVLTLPLLATAAHALFGGRAAVIFAWLVALTPLFVRNDTSDANNVPMLWWASGALVLSSAAWQRGSRAAAVGAATLAALATIARPEAIALTGLGGALWWWVHRRPESQGDAIARVAAACVAVVPIVLHLAHVGRLAVPLTARGGLADAGDVLHHAVGALLHFNLLWSPRIYPFALVLAAGWAVTRRGPGRRRRWGLLGFAVAAQLAYAVDIGLANMARVLVPAGLALTALAADGLVGLAGRWRRPAARMVALAIVGATAAPSALLLWAPTNEQAEEDLLAVALPLLPAEPFTLLRIGYEDQRADGIDAGYEKTHHHFPDYRIRKASPAGEVAAITTWLARPDRSRRTFAWLGVRCHARYRPGEATTPPAELEHPSCAALRAREPLRPLFERRVPNRGDVWLPYYPASQELLIGLYELKGPRAPGAAVP